MPINPFHCFRKLLKKDENIKYKHGLNKIRKIFFQYCDYTSIGGFRFFTPSTPRRIRIPATFLFGVCLGIVTYQIIYIMTSYSDSINVQYGTLVNSHFTPLPLVFICKPFGNETFYPFWKECQNVSTSVPKNVITRCYARMNGIKVLCDYRCVWTAQGFCLAVTPNMTSLTEFHKSSIEESQVESYFVILHVPEIAKASLKATPFEVYLDPYDETHTKTWNDNHAFSVRPSSGQIFPGLKTFIYIDEHYSLIVTSPEKRDYQHCIWEESEKTLNKTGCQATKFAPFRRPTMNFTVARPSVPASCVADALQKAQDYCVPYRTLLETYIVSLSVFPNFKVPDFYNEDTIFGNLAVSMSTTRSRVMYRMNKPQVWKLASDIGGTLSLYTGFTLMGIIETIFFWFSSNLRNLTAEDEQTAVERKNPPIKNPLNQPGPKKACVKIRQVGNVVKTKTLLLMKPVIIRATKVMAPVMTVLKNNKHVKTLMTKLDRLVKKCWLVRWFKEKIQQDSQRVESEDEKLTIPNDKK